MSTTEISPTTGAVAVVTTDDEYRQEAVKMLVALETAGAATETALVLDDPNMPFEQWQALGGLLGSIDRRSRWYLGDWLLFGESVFGEQASQALEGSTGERYDIAGRVTGLDHGTLTRIAKVCANVPPENRRRELGFWMHDPVSRLDPADQQRWLQRAVEEHWALQDLKQALKDATLPPVPASEPGTAQAQEPGLTASEVIEQAARVVVRTWQPTSTGDYVVPAEAAAQLLAALGGE